MSEDSTNYFSEKQRENVEGNYYTVLRCNEFATLDELKRNYQDLIKQYHPDKTGSTADKFIIIDKAFKTLKDEKSRKEYDASLMERSFNENPLIFAELVKKDLEFVNEEYLFTCRCGNDIVIPQDHLEGEVIFECSECSNCILVK